MGAWGVAAYDNDTAADWLFDKIKPAIDRAIYSTYSQPEEVLAALAVAVDLNLVPWLAWDRVEAALARIEASDAKTGWKEPEARAAYLKKLAKRLEAGRTPAAWTPLAAFNRVKAAKKKAAAKPRRATKALVKKAKSKAGKK